MKTWVLIIVLYPFNTHNIPAGTFYNTEHQCNHALSTWIYEWYGADVQRKIHFNLKLVAIKHHSSTRTYPLAIIDNKIEGWCDEARYLSPNIKKQLIDPVPKPIYPF